MRAKAWMGGMVLTALALLAPGIRADVDKYQGVRVRFATLANFPVSSPCRRRGPARGASTSR